MNGRKVVPTCWIVEVQLPNGRWGPCYEAEVNSSKEWAEEDKKRLQRKYSGSKYRVAQYQRPR
jgi:hypothetical protein